MIETTSEFDLFQSAIFVFYFSFVVCFAHCTYYAIEKTFLSYRNSYLFKR